jgi:hypothetical protein
MNQLRLARLAIAGALLVAAGAASAEGAGTIYERDNWPGALTKRSITLPSTLIDLKVPLVLNLSKDSELEPWFIAPAAAIGLTDDVTLRAYTPENGTGVCFAGTAHGCNERWNDLAAEVIYGFSRSEQQQLALRGGFEAYRMSDPLLLAMKLGGVYKTTIGNMAVVLGGDFRIGLTERDHGNIRETFTIYAEPQIQLTEAVAIFGEIQGEVELDPEASTSGVGIEISDTLRVPFAVGVEWELMHRVSLGGKLRFGNLFGHGGSADERDLTVFGEIFF